MPQPREMKKRMVDVVSTIPDHRQIVFLAPKPQAVNFAKFGTLYHKHRQPSAHLIRVGDGWNYDEVLGYIEHYSDEDETENAAADDDGTAKEPKDEDQARMYELLSDDEDPEEAEDPEEEAEPDFG